MKDFKPARFFKEVRQEGKKIVWPTRKETLITTAMVFVMVIIFSFGLTIEIVHYLHPYRYFEWADLLANFLGIIFAITIYKTLQKN